MTREAGGSQGFGRVSPVTRPSPYSPVEFRGKGAPSAGANATPRRTSAQRRRWRVFGRRTAALVAVLVALLAGVGYVGLFRSGAPVRTVDAPAPATKVALDDEASRIARSAIATVRR